MGVFIGGNGICMGEAGGTFVDGLAYCDGSGSRGNVLEPGFRIACIQAAGGNIQECVRFVDIFIRIVHLR